MDLDELIVRRRSLATALAAHESAVESFFDRSAQGVSFAIHADEVMSDPGAGKPPHMTSSASCYESLADQNPADPGLDAPWGGHARAFANRVLTTPPKQWLSDGSAAIYCRVRTLPMVLRFAEVSGPDEARGAAASDRITEVFSTVRNRPLIEAGLGETPTGPTGGSEAPYPPNAFHAYWGMRSLAAYRIRQNDGDLPELPSELDQLVERNRTWARTAIGRHTALLNAEKRSGDAQQLGYAVLADLAADPARVTPAGERHDLYEAAFAAFFAAQELDGRWPLSQPLFHYRDSGNAYCYTFETLAELLRPALARDAGRTFRAIVEPYLPSLLRAWDHAMATRIPLQAADTFGWSSAHHASRQDPEGWATAAVFSYGQMLRCVIGHVVAERAGTELNVRRPAFSDAESARKVLAERGQSYAEDGWTVGRELAAMFLNPIKAAGESAPARAEAVDPDAPLIGKEDARSAVLFGPPGTGKTSIVEALAGCLGWDYVEILASDFLSDGVDAVPARADRIFDLVMQLDRCVVLFDEIDELIRERSGDQSDPFGRFLTTSMLPKIAKLWKQGRVIFFVATNHVAKADSAITRSSRFDARVFVAPTGLQVKRALLDEALGESVAFDVDKVLAALDDPDAVDKKLRTLAALPLLRYDQVPELADRVAGTSGGDWNERLARALEPMVASLVRHEWQPANRNDEDVEDIVLLSQVYREYRNGVSHDESRRRMAIVGDRSTPDRWSRVEGTSACRIRGELPIQNGEVVALADDKDDGLLDWTTK